MYDRLQGLSLTLENVSLEPLSLATPVGWTRESTVVVFSGAGCTGRGEDVCYGAADQHAFRATEGAVLRPLLGATTFGEFSERLDALDLFDPPPARATDRHFRRWAVESAALDLALRQNGRSLAEVLDRSGRPVRYSVSTGLGTPPSTRALERVRAVDSAATFKVDLSEAWTQETVELLAAFGGVTTVDLKAHYRTADFRGPKPDAAIYRAIAEGLPDVWIEDPEWTGPAWDALAEHRDRVTWDAVLHSVADFDRLPAPPRCVNIKPSRFGRVAELLAVYELCEREGIAMYGGGQFELGPGRTQIQTLASLFHPDGANDVSPSGFNAEELDADLPVSPLAAASFGEATGFGLG